MLAFLLGVYLLTFSGRFHSIDELAALATVESVTREHTWRVPQFRWALGWTPTHVAESSDGGLYSKRGVGYSLAFWPLWQVGRFLEAPGMVQVAALTNVLATLATVALLMRLLVDLGMDEGKAAGVGLIYGLTTPAWPYARYLFSEPLTALYGAAALWLALSPRARTKPWAPLACGLVVGGALLVHAMNALLVVLFGGWWAWEAARRRTLAPLVGYGVGLLPGLAVMGWLNWARYGHPLRGGYTAPEERFVWDYARSLPGLLVSPGKGLVWFAPVVVPALLAWRSLWRRERAVALLLAAWVAGFLALVGGWFMWWGGWSWGARYWVAVLPALLLSLGWSGRWRPRLERPLLVGAAATGLAVNALGVAVDFNAPLVDLVQRGLPDTVVIWQWAYWPPWLHWQALWQRRLDLVWWQPKPDWAVVGALAALTATGFLGRWGRSGRGWSVRALLVAGMLAVAVWGLGQHPWGTADRTAAQVSTIVAQEARPGDVVLLELVPYFDYFATVQGWMNRYKAFPPYRTVVRGDALPPDVAAMRDGRLWFVTERTPPGDPAAQVEQQLLAHMALLDDRWVEEWRLVRFVPLPLDLKADREYSFVGGITVRVGVARVGDLVVVRCIWQSSTQIRDPFNVFVQLLGADGRVLAQHNRQPQNGQRPTTAWRPGEPVFDAYALPLQKPATLILGLYDPLTGTRIPLADGRGDDVVLVEFK